MTSLDKIGLTPKRRDKFLSLVARTSPTACHHWKGGKNGSHGRFYTKHTTQPHRIAWSLVNGPVPDKMAVVPTCGDTLCCNPQHLKLTCAKAACGMRRAA